MRWSGCSARKMKRPSDDLNYQEQEAKGVINN